ncbi:MAG TPA: efflux RND transporter periplasmic adaptor subunit [Candidatus Eisenbacteria bacterium]|nr:efflux RND transporter periplasmic adaptor subunit [Candidatus Eisenbacteria bacterium]
MNKRLIVVISALAVLVAGLGFMKFQQIRAAMAQTWSPPPEAVTTIAARQEQWPATTSVIGSVAAVQGVTVSADLPGIVQKIAFESGRRVQAGEVLVSLDVSQETAQLEAADAQRELARQNLDRISHLLEKEVVSQAEFDRASAEFKSAEARASEIRAIIDRKQIRAPFTGVLGIRQINLGQYLRAGDAVVPLQSLDPVYVNFSVPQQDLGDLRVGATVKAAAESVAVIAAGRVTAINSVVDEATRNVQIQAEFRNPEGTLRPGMFVEVEAKLGAGSSTVSLPATAVSYAPYGNSIFVVKDLKGPNGKSYRGVEQRFVKLGGSRGDQVAVVSGLKPGEEVVTSGVFKLRNGASVLVNNQVRPGNNPAPKPEDS